MGKGVRGGVREVCIQWKIECTRKSVRRVQEGFKGEDREGKGLNERKDKERKSRYDDNDIKAIYQKLTNRYKSFMKRDITRRNTQDYERTKK